MFKSYSEDTGELPTNKNHTVIRWSREDCQILFSLTNQGEALSSHFSPDKAGLRYIKDAVNDYCEYCKTKYSWCKMIIGKVQRQSVRRILVKCGFTEVHTDDVNKQYLLIRRL